MAGQRGGSATAIADRMPAGDDRKEQLDRRIQELANAMPSLPAERCERIAALLAPAGSRIAA